MALTDASGPSVYGNHRRPIAVPHRPRRRDQAAPQSQRPAQVFQAPPQPIQMHPQWLQLGLVPVHFAADPDLPPSPPQVYFRPVNPFQQFPQPDAETIDQASPSLAWNLYRAKVYHVADSNKEKKKKKKKSKKGKGATTTADLDATTAPQSQSQPQPVKHAEPTRKYCRHDSVFINPAQSPPATCQYCRSEDIIIDTHTTIRKVIEKRPKIIETAPREDRGPLEVLQEAVERWEKGYVIDEDAALEKMKRLIEELEGKMDVDEGETGLEPGEIAVDAAVGDSMNVDISSL